jgi:RimJ/RimL family protein N-acetyltransferase
MGRRPSPLLIADCSFRRAGRRLSRPGGGGVFFDVDHRTGDIEPLPLSDDYEVAWHLHPDHWGRGYATEASAAVLGRPGMPRAWPPT